MRVEKVIEYILAIQDPVDVCANPDNIRQILVHKFEGRCYNSCYIVKVLGINRRSECVINQDGHPTHGNVTVCFTVLAEEYVVGDIINGCEVTQVTNELIICKTAIANILIKRQESVQSVSLGQLIPVRVGGAMYALGADKVAINGELLVPRKKTTIMELTPASDGWSVGRALFDGVLARIREQQAALDSVIARGKDGETAVVVFRQFLHACKENYVATLGLQTADVVALVQGTGSSVDFGQFAGKCITRGLVQSLSHPTICVFDRADIDARIAEMAKTMGVLSKSFEVVPRPVHEAILSALEDYHNNLRTLRESVDIYSTPDLVKKHANLWQVMKKNQL